MQLSTATWHSLRASAHGDSPASVADYVLRALEVATPPVPVYDIARRLGIRVLEVPAPGWVAALDPTASPSVLWVDVAAPAHRKHYAIGHEFGHLLLHAARVYRCASFADQQDQAERQANDFASSLLVPLWMLEPLLTRSGITADDLAGMFRVPVGALDAQIAKFL